MPLTVGTRREQEDYEVIRKVGRGKYSEVFEGINVVNDQVAPSPAPDSAAPAAAETSSAANVSVLSRKVLLPNCACSNLKIDAWKFKKRLYHLPPVSLLANAGRATARRTASKLSRATRRSQFRSADTFSSLFPGPHIRSVDTLFLSVSGPTHSIRLSRCLQRAHEIAGNTDKTCFPGKSADERTDAQCHDPPIFQKNVFFQCFRAVIGDTIAESKKGSQAPKHTKP